MNKMKLRQIDINLLVVFDTVARLGSVQDAAEHLALSQSAVSHALNRLRKTMGDKLFLRGRNGLLMTPRAREIVGPVRDILASVEKVFNGDGFDPASSARVFRIAVADFSMLTIVPMLMQAMRAEAPDAQLDVSAIDPKTLDNLESGYLDCAFGSPPPDRSFIAQELCPVKFIGLVSARHPIVAEQENPTLEDYLSYPHISTIIDYQYGNPVDAALAALGRPRRIVTASRNFVTNLWALQNTDLILTTPTFLESRARLIYQALPDAQLATFSLPFAVPEYYCMVVWHRRTRTDPANQWLREMIFRIVKKFEA